MAQDDYFLSVVVPVYNEDDVLLEFHRRLATVLNTIPGPNEIVYVNDGSEDETLSIIETLRKDDERVALVNLSRNFGKEIAMTAGLDHARGSAVVVIDADLQDPPELIPELIQHWQAGFDVVYAQRKSRTGETTVKKLTATAFYRIIQRLGGRVQIPADTGDFRLLSRAAVDALRQVREQHRFMKGLFAWIGFSQKAVLYRRDARYAGKTKFNYWKLWNFSLDGITSFTTAPLKVATYLGFVTAGTALCYGIYTVYKTLMYGDPVRGFPALMTVMTFLGGVQLITLGVIGEYLGRIFVETKSRPLYLLQGYFPASGTGLRSAENVDRQLSSPV